MTRWVLSVWIAAALVLLGAQLAWTDWSFKAVERCAREAGERLEPGRVVGVDGAEVRRWPPGLRCHLAGGSRTVELAAGPQDWIWLVGVAGTGSTIAVALGLVPFALLRYRRRPGR